MEDARLLPSSRVTWGDDESNRFHTSRSLLVRVRRLTRRAMCRRRVPARRSSSIDHAPDRAAARDRDRALGDAPFVTVVHPDEHPATASVADAVGADGRRADAQPRRARRVRIDRGARCGAGPHRGADRRRPARAARRRSRPISGGSRSTRSARSTCIAARCRSSSAARASAARSTWSRGSGRASTARRCARRSAIGSFGARHVRVHYGDAHADGRLAVVDDARLSGRDRRLHVLRRQRHAAQPRATTRRRSAATTASIRSTARAGSARATAAPRAACAPRGSTRACRAASRSRRTRRCAVDARRDRRRARRSRRSVRRPRASSATCWSRRSGCAIRSASSASAAQERAYLTLSGGASSTWIAPIAGEHGELAASSCAAIDFRDRDVSGVQPTGHAAMRVGGAAIGARRSRARRASSSSRPRSGSTLVRTAPTPSTVGPDALMPRAVALGRPAEPAADRALRSSATTSRSRAAPAGTCGCRRWSSCSAIAATSSARRICGRSAGRSADLGVVWAPAARARARSIGCSSRPTGSSTRRTTRSRSSRPRATSRARRTSATPQSYGAELVASARIARSCCRLTASYTRLVTEQLTADVNLDGKPLPREPEQHAVRARRRSAHVRRSPARRLDRRELAIGQLPRQGRAWAGCRRVLVGAGARIELVARIALAASVANLADVRVAQLPLDPPPSPTFTRRRLPSPMSPGFRFPAAASTCPSNGVTDHEIAAPDPHRLRTRRLRRQPRTSHRCAWSCR